MDWLLMGLAAAIGAVVTILFNRCRSAYGTLTIKTDDVEKDFIHLAVEDLDQLYKKKFLVLDIVKDKNASK